MLGRAPWSAAAARGGVAHVARHPTEALDMPAGAILVAPSTDPSWTPIFLKAGALVSGDRRLHLARRDRCAGDGYPGGRESAGHSRAFTDRKSARCRCHARHRPASLERENHFSEVALRPVVLERAGNPTQLEASIDHRLQPVHLDCANHVFLVRPAADRDSAHAELSGEQCGDEHFARRSRRARR